MEYIFYGLLALVIILFIKSFLPVKGVRNITVEQLREELGDKGKQFVDVRTAAEYKAFHIRGFKNIPLHQLEQKASTLAKDKEVVLICQSGVRSMRAAKILKKAGFAKITNVKGGVNAWR
ncbi:MAG: rhodanese-like domain-containing protein [Bacillales bacterium]